MMTAPVSTIEDHEFDLSLDEAAILAVAAVDDTGEFRTTRPYGKPWGAECSTVKRLEVRGLMAFKADGRIPLTRDYLRISQITETGRTASSRACSAEK
jgi:hypothetical protein